MTKEFKNNVIIIPFNLPWEWSTDYTNQTAYILAKKNIVVCYMWAESFSLKEYIIRKSFPRFVKKHTKNIYLFYPLFLIPGKRLRLIHSLNERLNVLFLKLFVMLLSRKLRLEKQLLWIFDPSNRFVIDLLGAWWKTIYDCVDFFEGTASNPETKAAIIKNEYQLTREANLVTANSMVLQKHLKKYRKDVYLVPQGFRVQDFKKRRYKAPKIDMPHPVIGFAGAVNYRLNYNLLLPLVTKNPQWSFVIWGPVLEKEKVDQKTWQKMTRLLNLPNVSTGFLQDRTQLPGVFKQFDIAMIPYDVAQDFNRYCYPMKLFEFFYLGTPVVATSIEELKRFSSLVKIGHSPKDWEKIIRSLLAKPWPQSLRKKQRRLALENSWEKKVSTILTHLEQVDHL